MARVVVAALLLALVAVCAPPPTGGGHVAAFAVTGHRVAPAEAPAEEDPNRECRKGPEPRAFSTASQRFARQQTDREPVRPGIGCAPRRPPEPAPPAGDRRPDRPTPAALQVFRN